MLDSRTKNTFKEYHIRKPQPQYTSEVYESYVGLIVGHQGSGTGRPIYEVVFNGQRQGVVITTGNNGFIVGANPVSLP